MEWRYNTAAALRAQLGLRCNSGSSTLDLTRIFLRGQHSSALRNGHTRPAFIPALHRGTHINTVPSYIPRLLHHLPKKGYVKLVCFSSFRRNLRRGLGKRDGEEHQEKQKRPNQYHDRHLRRHFSVLHPFEILEHAGQESLLSCHGRCVFGAGGIRALMGITCGWTG